MTSENQNNEHVDNNQKESDATSSQNTTQIFTDNDYEAVEAAVLQTDRGRWFLKEYQARNRHANTKTILSAFASLKEEITKSLNEKTDNHNTSDDRIRIDIIDMAEAITRTKNEITQIKPENSEDDQIANASNELDAIVEHTEAATSTILESAEKIQEVVWTMREEGATQTKYDLIDDMVTEVYTACSFQDITGQRISKIINVMRYLERRIEVMMEIWGIQNASPQDPSKIEETNSEKDSPKSLDERPDAHLLNGPALQEEAQDQDDIDTLMQAVAAMPHAQEHLEDETPQSTDEDINNDAVNIEAIDNKSENEEKANNISGEESTDEVEALCESEEEIHLNQDIENNIDQMNEIYSDDLSMQAAPESDMPQETVVAAVAVASEEKEMPSPEPRQEENISNEIVDEQNEIIEPVIENEHQEDQTREDLQDATEEALELNDEPINIDTLEGLNEREKVEHKRALKTAEETSSSLSEEKEQNNNTLIDETALLEALTLLDTEEKIEDNSQTQATSDDVKTDEENTQEIEPITQKVENTPSLQEDNIEKGKEPSDLNTLTEEEKIALFS